MGHLINRRTKELSDDDITKIASIYHNWRSEDNGYEDIKGLCKTSNIDEVAKLDYVLTPGRYVGLEEVEEDFDFKERFAALQAEFQEQLKEETELNKRIIDNLAKVKVNG
jgi:type I restriction enzyme M protein